MSVCPALRRVEGGFICNYSGKPVNPFDWYCIGNYAECPVYIRFKSQQTTQTVQQQQQAQQAVQVVQLSSVERVETDFDKAIKPVVDNLFMKYDEVVKKLDESWQSYESSVLNFRRQWEAEKMILKRSIDLLASSISNYEKALRELELKRDLMPEEQYAKTRQEIEEKLGALKAVLEDVERRYSSIEEIINQHFKRVLATSTNAEVINLRVSLSRLDEMLKEGKISREAYERLKKELEGVVP
ncbi:hypothetical protein [Thermoproteus tenax]|uniref:Uncharacterized protein n=1 Tax=Thermoproteus tenax (strain ATCC 35583 / DSM 2078 / JCM 9277 / NBRC 100435 / Kra 1) TaxID=768679 RepID=G4RLQ0_THETK|nr:hypothetical protein [Thermoproteus tenax]CCC82495.1 hypothetical protein TTX_1879 [Thermoproteus tenax Kra 1]